MDAAQALSDLTEISSQIEAAVVLDAVGRVSGDGGKELAQLEIATADGSVFVVRDEHRTIAATTGREPTVGLVFYDLKSCLRSVAAEEKPKPKRTPRASAKGDDGDTAAESAHRLPAR